MFVVAPQKRLDAGSLNAESRRYLERLLKLGRRNGLHLPPETQEVTLWAGPGAGPGGGGLGKV